jgi:predicted protein tyrosine phosphatase
MSADRFISDDGVIRVVELGIDADEERNGALQAYAVTWLNTVTVMVHHKSGVIASGTYQHRDLVIARAKARESAFNRLKHLSKSVPWASLLKVEE